MRNWKGRRGVTLIELCFALAIVAMLVGMAAPGFHSSLRAAAVRSATFELLAGLQQTRANSILEARPAEVCPSDAAGNCLAANTPSSYWSSCVRAEAGESRPVSHALPAGVVVRATRSPLRFWPDALSASTGTLTICDRHGIAAPRAIVLSLSGRARLADAASGKCR
jgi:type IV fimbrial biogenesis protein FimT